MTATEQEKGDIPITSEGDIVTARKSVRDATTRLGFGVTDVTRIVTTTSELARNVFLYAGAGALHWRRVEEAGKAGIELTFEDSGPGIPNVEQAMEAGWSSGRSLGMGLPGAKRLMDEMEIHSEVGKGTTVTVRKWLRGF